jgi:hypothetical protein
MRFMHIAGQAAAGTTAQERLRRQIDDLSHELATLADLAAKEASNARPDGRGTSIQTGRALALQTQVTDKRTQLEALIERERKLGTERVRETGRASLAIGRVKPVRHRTGASFTLRRRSVLLLALAPVAIISIAVLSLQLGDLVGRRAEPIDSTVNSTNEVVPAISGPVGDPSESFFSRETTFSYTDGRVFLSGQPYPGAFAMDDQIEITVIRPDGNTSIWTSTFDEDCGEGVLFPPQDLTHLFALGLNTVTVVLSDRCGETRGVSGPVVLSNQP